MREQRTGFIRFFVGMFFAGIFLCSAVRADNADAILGTYVFFDYDTKITVHINFHKAENNTYQARIVWLDQPDDDLGKPKTDVNNPRSELRHIPVTQVLIVRGLRFDGDDEWEGGRIYNPVTGKTYRCYVNFEDANTLRVKAYINFFGFSFLGRSFYWSRVR